MDFEATIKEMLKYKGYDIVDISDFNNLDVQTVRSEMTHEQFYQLKNCGIDVFGHLWSTMIKELEKMIEPQKIYIETKEDEDDKRYMCELKCYFEKE